MNASFLPDVNESFKLFTVINEMNTSFLSDVNETSKFLIARCHFHVDLFSYVNANGTKSSTYPALSNQAHIVLGICIYLMVLDWAALVLGVIKNRRKCYIISGSIQIIMGVYLLFWVFVILHPSNIFLLYEYTTNDLLQLQHLAIALLLLGSGISEICSAVWRKKDWHVIWCINLCTTGVIFLIHPQEVASAVSKHVLLGCSIMIGSVFLMLSKRDGFCSIDAIEMTDIDGYLLVAGSAYAFAGGILIGFREKKKSEHFGYIIGCKGIWPVVRLSYVVSLGTITCILIKIAWRQCEIYAKKKKTTKTTNGRKYHTVELEPMSSSP